MHCKAWCGRQDSRHCLCGTCAATVALPTELWSPLLFVAALQICGPGVPVSEIGEVCQAVAQKHKVSVVRDFIGHGVGTVFHAEPQVMHHKNNFPGTMQVRQQQGHLTCNEIEWHCVLLGWHKAVLATCEVCAQSMV